MDILRPAPTASLLDLPNEILLQIFVALPPQYSACLGITCRRLYNIHYSVHGTIKLTPVLILLLKNWMGATGRRYSHFWNVFVHLENDLRNEKGLWRRASKVIGRSSRQLHTIVVNGKVRRSLLERDWYKHYIPEDLERNRA